MNPWPLAALLALRRRDEDAARDALAGALAAEARRRREREERAEASSENRRRREEAALALDGAAGEGTRALAALAAFAGRLRGERLAQDAALAAASGALSAAAAEVGRRRGAVAAARLSVRELELRRDRWEAQRRLARERRDEAEADDRVSARAAAR